MLSRHLLASRQTVPGESSHLGGLRHAATALRCSAPQRSPTPGTACREQMSLVFAPNTNASSAKACPHEPLPRPLCTPDRPSAIVFGTKADARRLSGFGLGPRRDESRRQARRRRGRVADPHNESVTTHGGAKRPGPSGWACKGAHAALQMLIEPLRLGPGRVEQLTCGTPPPPPRW